MRALGSLYRSFKRACVVTSTDQEIILPHTETHANDPYGDTAQTRGSQHRQGDDTHSEERIRERAYELYIERGAQPGDSVGDWLTAEREYYGQP
jgi:hypothetical protein